MSGQAWELGTETGSFLVEGINRLRVWYRFIAGYTRLLKAIQGSKLGMYMRSLANVNKESNPGISANVAGLASAQPQCS